MMKLFYNYSIDCELPPDDLFDGPKTWDIAEASARGFVDLMDELGAREGTSLFVYPDVAKHQHKLYREMADAGIEVALHLNGMRYSRMRENRAWLGSLSYDKQKEALRNAKQDLEDVIGRPVLGYRACYASGNNDTFPICEELGFVWTSTSARRRYRADTFANWSGSWEFPYHPNPRCRLIPGTMKIFEMPVTRSLHTFLNDDRNIPLDVRAETPVSIAGEDRKAFRDIIEENLVEIERREIPLRMIAGASHNTNPFGQRDSFQSQNVRYFTRYAKELIEARGYDFTPASFLQMFEEGERVDSY